LCGRRSPCPCRCALALHFPATQYSDPHSQDRLQRAFVLRSRKPQPHTYIVAAFLVHVMDLSPAGYRLAAALSGAGCPGGPNQVIKLAAACIDAGRSSLRLSVVRAAWCLSFTGFRTIGDLDSASCCDIPDLDKVHSDTRAFLAKLVAGQTAIGAALRLERARLLPASAVAAQARSAAVTRLGPAAATRVLCNAVKQGLPAKEWREQMRVEVILGSAPRSLAGAVCALKCWGAFADAVLGANGAHLPPDVDGLIVWSKLFRNSRTFANYVSKIRFGCEIAGAVFGHQILFDSLRSSRVLQACRQRTRSTTH
jgi:hypothetical protein